MIGVLVYCLLLDKVTCFGPRCLGDLSMEIVSEDSPAWMLSLLQVLAEDLWPRAAVGEVDLDSELIAKQAFKLLDTSSATCSSQLAIGFGCSFSLAQIPL